VSDPARPTAGARFALERERDDGASATYAAMIATPDAVYRSTALLRDDGTVELPPTGAPGELDKQLAVLAKLTARSATKKREDGLPAWPARIQRWRGPR
jgi:hypothetical protein